MKMHAHLRPNQHQPGKSVLAASSTQVASKNTTENLECTERQCSCKYHFHIFTEIGQTKPGQTNTSSLTQRQNVEQAATCICPAEGTLQSSTLWKKYTGRHLSALQDCKSLLRPYWATWIRSEGHAEQYQHGQPCPIQMLHSFQLLHQVSRSRASYQDFPLPVHVMKPNTLSILLRSCQDSLLCRHLPAPPSICNRAAPTYSCSMCLRITTQSPTDKMQPQHRACLQSNPQQPLCNGSRTPPPALYIPKAASSQPTHDATTIKVLSTT